uniref:Uncharacterized protein n=1 Tax=Triticum urartu TaxID=4572 RepID=A0A8R7TL18_TRIUA
MWFLELVLQPLVEISHDNAWASSRSLALLVLYSSSSGSCSILGGIWSGDCSFLPVAELRP